MARKRMVKVWFKMDKRVFDQLRERVLTQSEESRFVETCIIEGLSKKAKDLEMFNQLSMADV